MSEPTEAAVPIARRFPFAAALVFAGLVIELLSLLVSTPGTFLLFVGLGLPLLAAGPILFLRDLWRVLVDRGAL